MTAFSYVILIIIVMILWCIFSIGSGDGRAEN